jgi:putative copper export protein
VRFVHVLSAATWVGGQLLLSLLVLPVLRRRLDAAARAP